LLVPRFPLIDSCYKIVNSQTSFMLCKESEILERSVSDILPPTPQPCSLEKCMPSALKRDATKQLKRSWMIPNAYFDMAVALQTKISINLGSIPNV